MKHHIPDAPTKRELAWSYRTQTIGAPSPNLWSGELRRTTDALIGHLSDTYGWSLTLTGTDKGADGFYVIATVATQGQPHTLRQDYGLRQAMTSTIVAMRFTGALRKDGRVWAGKISAGPLFIHVIGRAKAVGIMILEGEG